MKKNTIDLSIIIVYYGGFNELLSLLTSINKNRIKHKHETIVVNNKLDEEIGSKLKKKFKDIIYIKSKGNIGYAKGNNLGIQASKGKYLFVLNPDTKIVSGSIDRLIDFLYKNENYAVIAPNLVDTNGNFFLKQGTRILTPIRAIFSLTILSKVLPNNKVFREYFMLDIPKQTFRNVDVVPGSAFIVKKEIFEKVGGFDENFFLFFEEMDLCKRIRKLGYKIAMSSGLVMEHDWSENEGNNELKKVFAKSRFYYFRKHYGLISAIAIELISKISKWSTLIIALLVLLAILLQN